MDEKFQWILFYEALADKLLEYKDKQPELFELMKNLADEQPNLEYLHFRDRDQYWAPRNYRIDPFSVMAVINRGAKDELRIALAKALAVAFDLDIAAPNEFAGIPELNAQRSFFVGNDEMWSLFVEAIQSANTGVFTVRFNKAFEKAIATKGDGLTSVTIGLYWIRPQFFLPLVNNLRKYIKSKYSLKVPGGRCSGRQYIEFLAVLKNEISEKTPGLTFPEIMEAAYIEAANDKTSDNEWWPPLSEYDPGITKEKWLELLKDSSIFDDNSKLVMSRFLEIGGAATCKQLSEEYGETPNFYNGVSIGLAKRVAQNTGCSLLEGDEAENSHWWPVLFVGRHTEKDEVGTYMWKLRPELKAALEEINMPNPRNESSRVDSKFSKNLILYGPPGTGKTYSSVLYAVAIIEDKPLEDVQSEDYDQVFSRYQQYLEDNLITFIIFHQSFGYEEFIEGIRPVISDESSQTGGQIEYELHDGVFKDFCEKATENAGKNHVFIIDEINRGNISKIFGELITLIEPTKRLGAQESSTAILPYSGDTFGVPDNVYIIGTMNTADRSIALLDTALRRRFRFVEMQPRPDLLKDVVVEDRNIGEMLKVINQRITILLDREHTIGHSFLLPLKDENTIEKLAEIFEFEIMPLLQEYFFDDYEKIRLVLGDTQKTKEDEILCFVIKQDGKQVFGNSEEPTEYYEINREAFRSIDAYKYLQ